MASIRDIDVMIGANIRKYREAQHITQERLAELSDINSKLISAYECGTRRISIHKLVLIANALGVTMDVLFSREERSETDELMSRINAAILGVLRDYDVSSHTTR